MRKVNIDDGYTRFTRISKFEARNRFDRGEPVYIISHKLRPGRPFSLGMTLFPVRTVDDDRNFNDLVRDYCNYNNSYEAGYYPAFYIESPSRIIHHTIGTT